MLCCKFDVGLGGCSSGGNLSGDDSGVLHSLSESSPKSSRNAWRLRVLREAGPCDEEATSIGEQCIGMSKTSSWAVDVLAS